nr:MAG TPA_asm: hypothetical protein [Caudoviricetes sp.]
MRQKTITVNYRVRATNEYALESLIQEFEDNVQDLISLFTEDEEGRIAATYWYGDQEVNSYFYDNEIWEGITEYAQVLLKEGKIYALHPYITSMERNGNIVSVEMIVYMPWDKAEAPALPEAEQTYTATSSISAEKLFNKYTPIEVYRANYVYRKWGGIAEKGESDLFEKDKQLIDFDKFNSLPINLQDRLADTWLDRMKKTTVENPTNPGLRMNVPLDLSVYGTSWKELDLSNEPLLNLIETENKILAIYVRTRRMGYRLSPEEFVAGMNLDNMDGTIMKRMHDVYDNNRV